MDFIPNHVVVDGKKYLEFNKSWFTTIIMDLL